MGVVNESPALHNVRLMTHSTDKLVLNYTLPSLQDMMSLCVHIL